MGMLTMASSLYYLRSIILRLLREPSPVTALCLHMSKRWSPLTESGSISSLLLSHMRQLHSRSLHVRWTSLSSDSGPTGTRRPRSSSCSSASSCPTPGVEVPLQGPLPLPWCLHLPSRFHLHLGCLHLQCLQGQHLPKISTWSYCNHIEIRSKLLQGANISRT